MAKGAHSFSRSHSPTRSNSARSSGQSHLSKVNKQEKDQLRRMAQVKLEEEAEAGRMRVKFDPQVQEEALINIEMMRPVWRKVKKEAHQQLKPVNHWIIILDFILQTEAMHPIDRKVEAEEAGGGGVGIVEEVHQTDLLSVHWTVILNLIPQTEVMHPAGRKVEAEEAGGGGKGIDEEVPEEGDQQQAETDLLSVHWITKVMHPVCRKAEAEEAGGEEGEEMPTEGEEDQEQEADLI
ncbi:hypothetical protein T4D_13041 [Trichinella pseudospiralis]|uniref:Uncharacterized protein n=1 Tax=Trichinella pseudospiralis TaxID=6337 RepID=A0A0V1FYV5_TRIPS|nr:hypothetical protein T4D_13041 [Trichinella pseudospiralis]